MLYCIVSGNTSFDDYNYMCRSLDEIFAGRGTVHIITGAPNKSGTGADALAKQYALSHKDRCRLHIFYADWATYQREAGKHCAENMYSFASKHDENLAILFGDDDGALKYKLKCGKESGVPTRRFR